ncbi:MAG: hypothetical protein LBS06_07460 [Treponema sp.]|jgi:hypothetical protein|nr:hypothetical protein [Treponema sp.]
MIAETTREPEMGLTFEKVWAMFQETDRRMRESRVETDRRLEDTDRRLEEMGRFFRESRVEMDRFFRESRMETDRQFRETDRKIGKLGGRLGELVEHLVAPNILEKFNDMGFCFGKIGLDVIFKDAGLSPVAEVDILLENGDAALAVEVKSKLTIDDIQEHVDRMEKLRRYADGHGDRRRLIGAVAGAIIPAGVKPFALKNGFYVLEQTGDTVCIDVPEGFKPKEW